MISAASLAISPRTNNGSGSNVRIKTDGTFSDYPNQSGSVLRVLVQVQGFRLTPHWFEYFI
jgi:hypothetical protein